MLCHLLCFDLLFVKSSLVSFSRPPGTTATCLMLDIHPSSQSLKHKLWSFSKPLKRAESTFLIAQSRKAKQVREKKTEEKQTELEMDLNRWRETQWDGERSWEEGMNEKKRLKIRAVQGERYFYVIQSKQILMAEPVSTATGQMSRVIGLFILFSVLFQNCL